MEEKEVVGNEPVPQGSRWQSSDPINLISMLIDLRAAVALINDL